MQILAVFFPVSLFCTKVRFILSLCCSHKSFEGQAELEHPPLVSMLSLAVWYSKNNFALNYIHTIFTDMRFCLISHIICVLFFVASFSFSFVFNYIHTIFTDIRFCFISFVFFSLFISFSFTLSAFILMTWQWSCYYVSMCIMMMLKSISLKNIRHRFALLGRAECI